MDGLLPFSFTMKALSTLFAAVLGLALISGRATAQATPPEQNRPPHRVVFEITSSGTETWNHLLTNVENLRRALGPSAQVEIVAHGAGLGLLLRSNTGLAPRMEKLAGAGVEFAACQNTMKRQHVTVAELLPFTKTVDSGVAELVRRQNEGWAYIHVGG